MPLGSGWWIHRDGRVVPIYEHRNAVATEPATFGLRPDDVQRAPAEEDEAYRRRVLTATMRKGWIRVRSYRGETVFETWRVSREAARAIRRFVDEELQPGFAATITVKELSTGRSDELAGWPGVRRASARRQSAERQR